MSELLFTCGVLVIVVVGLLVMMQLLDFDLLARGTWRALLLLTCAGVTLWLLKALVLLILLCALVRLTRALLLALVTVLAILALAGLLRTLATRSSVSEHGKNHKGE